MYGPHQARAPAGTGNGPAKLAGPSGRPPAGGPVFTVFRAVPPGRYPLVRDGQQDLCELGTGEGVRRAQAVFIALHDARAHAHGGRTAAVLRDAVHIGEARRASA